MLISIPLGKVSKKSRKCLVLNQISSAFFHNFLIFTNFPHSDFTSGGKLDDAVDDDGDDFNFFVGALFVVRFSRVKFEKINI